MSAPRTLSVVGSTGSIGMQALEVVRRHPERYQVVALGAYRQVAVLAAQAKEFRPAVVALGDPSLAPALAGLVPEGTEVLAGPETMAEVATCAEVVLNAVVGFAGLPVTLAALHAGHRLALANKESLVAGAPVVQAARRSTGAEIVPVDSEHSAIHQCLRSSAGDTEVAKLTLTASGGPFRGLGREELARVGVEQALAHPTWKMGPKITVDSSTLMNKGLEVIEAHELFGLGYERIDVVVHPQSIIHSMVEMVDGATIAQLSQPDMRLPIGYALSYPDRLDLPFGAIDWTKLSRLDFDVPDRAVFSCLELACQAGRAGGAAPAWLNAANEVAVAAFLQGKLPWLGIAAVVEDTLSALEPVQLSSVEEVLDADRQARWRAGLAVEHRTEAA